MITIDALTLRTDDRTLVDGVTMHLAEGALHLLAGTAGAGKTALLEALAGLRRAASGSATRFGRPLRPREVAYVPHDPRLYAGLTGRDLAELALRYRPEGSDTGTDTEALLGAFDLPADTPVEGWSPARRRQLALVAALLRRPAVVLLDEPVEGFDAAALRTARRLLQCERARGTTLIVATRRPLTLADMADELHLLAGGALCRQYRGDELVAALCAAQGFGGSGKSS